MRIQPRLNIGLIACFLVLVWACGSNKKSGRDARREQIHNNAKLKKLELDEITGTFFGNLQSQSLSSKGITLSVEVKEIPEQQEGFVDPILVPTLSGYVKFNYGAFDNVSEQISFTLIKGNYDAKRGQLDLVAHNESYKNLILSLQKISDDEITGTWTAPEISEAGSTVLLRSVESGGVATLVDYTAPSISGEYKGFIEWADSGDQQAGVMTIVSSFAPPDGISINGNARIFVGGADSNEYLTYSLDEINYNPINGRINIASSTDSDIVFSGELSKGLLAGNWGNNIKGNAGNFSFGWAQEFPDSLKGESLMIGGNYPAIFNWRSDSQYQTGEFTIVTSSNENSISLNVSLKLVFGNASSPEYMTFAFPNADFDPWTKRLVLESNDNEVKFKGTLRDGKIEGNWSNDYRGSMGSVIGSKISPPAPDLKLAQISALNGTYRGKIKNTNPNSNMPPLIQMSFISSRDLSSSIGLAVNGSCRFYLGPFESLEYVQVEFESVRFNFFTRELIAVTKESSLGVFTVRAKLSDGKINGDISESSLGVVGEIITEKI